MSVAGIQTLTEPLDFRLFTAGEKANQDKYTISSQAGTSDEFMN